MQSCSDHGFYGGGGLNPHELKKKETFLSLRFLPLASFSLTNGFNFVVHLFKKTLQMLKEQKREAQAAKQFQIVTLEEP